MTTAATSPTNQVKSGRASASLPFEPLWDAAKTKARVNPYAAVGFTVITFSEMVGFNQRAVTRWTDNGYIPWISADEAATNLGYHPIQVWGFDEWLNVKGDFDAIASGKRDAVIDKALDDAMAYVYENAIDLAVEASC